MKTLDYTLPECFASYLVNGDLSGLNNTDIEIINDFLENENLGACINVSEDSFFAWRHDCPKIGGATCAVFTFLVKE